MWSRDFLIIVAVTVRIPNNQFQRLSSNPTFHLKFKYLEWTFAEKFQNEMMQMGFQNQKKS